jgi:hypothetical protein
MAEICPMVGVTQPPAEDKAVSLGIQVAERIEASPEDGVVTEIVSVHFPQGVLGGGSEAKIDWGDDDDDGSDDDDDDDSRSPEGLNRMLKELFESFGGRFPEDGYVRLIPDADLLVVRTYKSQVALLKQLLAEKCCGPAVPARFSVSLYLFPRSAYPSPPVLSELPERRRLDHRVWQQDSLSYGQAVSLRGSVPLPGTAQRLHIAGTVRESGVSSRSHWAPAGDGEIRFEALDYGGQGRATGKPTIECQFWSFPGQPWQASNRLVTIAGKPYWEIISVRLDVGYTYGSLTAWPFR